MLSYKPYLLPIDLVPIGLKRAEQAVSSLSGDKQQGYQPKTITTQNRNRLNFLPLFPTEAFGPNDPLLLSNVSGLFVHMNIYSYHIILSFVCQLSSKSSYIS
jgi:hypothetical protein